MSAVSLLLAVLGFEFQWLMHRNAVMVPVKRPLRTQRHTSSVIEFYLILLMAILRTNVNVCATFQFLFTHLILISNTTAVFSSVFVFSFLFGYEVSFSCLL